jgi:hypothetical protein
LPPLNQSTRSGDNISRISTGTYSQAKYVQRKRSCGSSDVMCNITRDIEQVRDVSGRRNPNLGSQLRNPAF